MYIRVHLNKVLQKFWTANTSSSVAKHKLPRDTKKQQDNVITSNRAILFKCVYNLHEEIFCLIVD